MQSYVVVRTTTKRRRRRRRRRRREIRFSICWWVDPLCKARGIIVVFGGDGKWQIARFNAVIGKQVDLYLTMGRRDA